MCFLFGWAPYFCQPSLWNDASLNDPIKLGLQSSLYSYVLVAGISASFPPCLELIYYIIATQGNLAKRTIIILSNMFIFIYPELISLILVWPSTDSKLYFLLLNNRINTSLFLAMMLLCQYSEKSWRCKLTTVITSFIYIGSFVNSLAPYFGGIMGISIQKFGTLLQFVGCLIFIVKSYKYLRKNSVAKETENFMIVDDLMCKFITLSALFIIVGMFCVYISAGFPYWTQWDSSYIACYDIIFTLPNVLLGVAFAHATRNKTVYLQVNLSINILMLIYFFRFIFY